MTTSTAKKGEKGNKRCRYMLPSPAREKNKSKRKHEGERKERKGKNQNTQNYFTHILLLFLIF